MDQTKENRAWWNTHANCVVCAAFALTLAVVDRSGADELLTTDALWVTGTVEIAAGWARVHTGDPGCPAVTNEVLCPVDKIVALRAGRVASQGCGEPRVYLVGGDMLSGAIAGASNGLLRVRGDALGEIELAFDDAICIRLAGGRDVAERPPRGSRGVVFVNGDEMSGDVAGVGDAHVFVAAGKRTNAVVRSRCAWIRFADIPAGEPVRQLPADTRHCVLFTNGDVLSGTIEAMDAGGMTLRARRRTYSIPRDRISEVWTEGPALAPLSLAPVSACRQTPQFDENFPHRLDANLDGGRLRIAGKSYARGIACHSRCELEYRLDGVYSRFIADIGIDDTAPRDGLASFLVEVDGKAAASVPAVRAGESARTIHADLKGAQVLRLIVDFGGDGVSLGDHADWARPVLVR